MRIWKIAIVAALAVSSFAAENVAPTKSELEEMYNKAFREFDANNFPEALKELDAIDARQPDLAASQNLRGVILMRQGIYDKAEVALLEAARIDPKFWNARFNQAEIPFLKKDWTEARNRFQQLLSNSKSDLASEAAQLIQYKILLTYLLEGKENMVDSILAKLELSPDTPAVDYVKAAVALQHKNEKEAKDWISLAGKNFSPQLNKLFAESLYEVGWLEKPTGQPRASLPLMTAAERTEKTKATARSKFEQAQQALRQRDLATARKLVDEADQAGPNQPATLNMRGEILMEQKEFDEAEAAFKKAAKLDPKFREAQYNLAQIPFKKKDYAKARERFEALFKQTPGGDKNQAAELIKFKIYMTLLLEGKDSRAQAIMEQFQFTGDTPALYYAQAAWEFKHNNPEKAADWTASAKRIYSEALNSVFADAFYDVGWMQSPAIAAAPAPTIDAAAAMATQTEAGPAIEPSPIPDSVVAANKQAKESSIDSSLALSSSTPGTPIAGMETATAEASQSPTQNSNESIAAGAPAEAAIASPPGPTSAAESPVAPAAPAEAPAVGETKTSAQTSSAPVVGETKTPGQTSAGPAVTTKPAIIPSAPRVAAAPLASRRTLLVGGLLLAGLFLLAWVVVPQLRRRALRTEGAGGWQAEFPASSRTFEPSTAPSEKGLTLGNHLFGGPRQVSLQLTASKPSLRRGALPSINSGAAFCRSFDQDRGTTEAPAYNKAEPDRELPVISEPVFEPMSEQFGGHAAEGLHAAAAAQAPNPVEGPMFTESTATSSIPEEESIEAPLVGEQLAMPDEASAKPEVELIDEEQPVRDEALLLTESTVTSSIPEEESIEAPMVAEQLAKAEAEPIDEEQLVCDEAPVLTESAATSSIPEDEWIEPPMVAEQIEMPDEGLVKSEAEPIVQEPAIPDDLVTVGALQSPEVRPIDESVSYFPNVISSESVFPQTTTPAIMPQTTPIPTAPVTKTPATAVTKPQPAGTMHTSVQITFSFEIAAVQLTPTFKMGVLQVRPTSKIVTMRLASTQQPQPAMNFQASFEIAKIQPAGGSFGTIRMTPSQQQRPTASGSPSFAVAGLQVVPNAEATPVQLMPSQQGQAAVFVTIPFQITTIDFSPSLEIASVVLNSNSNEVLVQLPGAGEGAPIFEIANLQLSDSGDIAMMQLNLVDHGPKPM